MIQQFSGQEYGVGKNGIGAVGVADSNLNSIIDKTWDDAKDYARLRQAEKAHNQNVANQLYASLAMKEAQVRPADEKYFKAKTAEIYDRFAKTLAKYRGNTADPNFQAEMAQIKGLKEQTEIGLQASAGAYKGMLDVLGKFDPEKDDPSILQNIQLAMAQSPEDAWEKGGAAAWDLTTKPRQGTLNEFLGKYLKPFNDKIRTQKEIVIGDKGMITEVSKTFNFTQPEAQKFANDIYATDKYGSQVADEQWSLESPDVKKTYTDKFTDPNQPQEMAEIKGKKAWLADRILTRQLIAEQEDYKSQEEGYKEGVKFAFGKKNEAIKGRRFPEIVSALALGDADMMRQVPLTDPSTGVPYKNPDGSEKTVYGTTLFNQFPLKEKRAGIYQGDPERNDRITVAFKDDATGKIHIETEFSKEDAAAGKRPTPYIKFNTPQEFMDYMANSASGIKDIFGTPDQWTAFLDSKGARVGQTDFDPTRVIDWTAEREQASNVKKVSKNVYIPVGQKKAQQPTKTKTDYSQYPQSSDGKWYFDGKEWKATGK